MRVPSSWKMNIWSTSLSRKCLSCETMIRVPLNSLRYSSNTFSVTMSRSFVGSSMTRRFG